MLALVLFAVIGWFIFLLPKSPSRPDESHSEDREQLASLSHINPLPVVQEVERSPRDVPVSLPAAPPPAPPAVNSRPSDPPPAIEIRPPDLPPPARQAKAPPKKKQTVPNVEQEEADSLVQELVKAAPQQQEGLLEKLRQGKGAEYTQALAVAIGRLSDTSKKKAQQAMADRLTRFTAKTLLSYLGDENPELRRAAALALGMKDNKDHVSDLIGMLEDPDPSVVQAVQTALKKLTNQVAAPAKSGEDRSGRTPSPGTKPPVPDSQASRSKQQKKDEDMPDVSLVPPEETSTAVKAIIKANAVALHSKRPSERIQAAQVLGGLGEAGKPARRLLCAAMLDPVAAVRVAAADALKDIDPKMHYLALVLSTQKVESGNDVARITTLLKKIQKLEEDGEPLAPLIAFVAKFAASKGFADLFTTALTTLAHVGRRDLSSYRVVATVLTSRDAPIRTIALHELARMKHGKLAVPRILVLLKHDTPANRIAAIEALTVLTDESTEEIITDAIAALRYHPDEAVRKAVETALNKLENKQAP